MENTINKITDEVWNDLRELHKHPETGEDLEVEYQDAVDIVKVVLKGLGTDFKTASRPLIKYLSENHHPHVTAIVSGQSTELLEGKESHPKILDYVVD